MNCETAKSTILKDARQVQDQAVERASEALDTMTREAAAARKVVQRSASDVAAEVTRKLKEAGVDTDQLIIAAREQASDLQRRLVDQVQDRPLRALGFAALAGLAIGFITKR